MAEEEPLKLHRVKVYRLGEDGQWLDRGVGHVSAEFLEVSRKALGSQTPCLCADRCKSPGVYFRARSKRERWDSW